MTTENNAAPVVTAGQRYNQAVDQGGIDSFKAAEAAFAAEEMGQPAPESKPEIIKDPASVEQDLSEEGKAEGEGAEEGTEEGAEGGEAKEGSEEGAEAKEAKEGQQTEGKKKHRVPAAKRIAELTKARGDAERRAEAHEQENKELKDRLAALERGEKPKPAPAVDANGDLVEPDPEKFEYGALDPAYTKAVREYDRAVLKRDMDAERQREAAERTASERRDRHMTQVEDLDKEVGDFVEVVVQGAQEGKWACTPLMNEFIMDSDHGARIAYHLAKNPAEAKRVAAMSERDTAKWFGRKEAELAAPSDKGKQPAKTAAISKADPPFEPARGNNGKFKTKGDTTDYAAFERDHKHLLENPTF